MNATPLSLDENALVESHLNLVGSLARGWASRCRGGIDPADLVQAGTLGLIEAARRYDPSRDASFAAFAAQRVRGAICDYLRAHDPLTRSRRGDVRELESATRALETGLGRAPSTDELAGRLKWEPARMDAARGDAQALRQGWAQVQDATDSGAHFVPCPQPGPHEALAHGELRERLAALIDLLPEREKLVLSLYYFEEMPLRSIAEILGVTESRVSQLHSAALRRLRAKTATETLRCA